MSSRTLYEDACKRLVDKYSKSDNELTRPYEGWSWNEHPYYQHLGYLARKTKTTTRYVTAPDEDNSYEEITEEIDLAAADAVTSTCYEVDEYVVFSPSFQVPAFYFTVHTSSGSPLPLDDVLKTSLLRPCPFPDGQRTGYSIKTPDSPFPLLSQGDHPTLGTPCWYLHPCESPKALAELIQEEKQNNRYGELDAVRQLELWLLLVGNIINLSV